jgi:hypothetical protein
MIELLKLIREKKVIGPSLHHTPATGQGLQFPQDFYRLPG